MESPAILDLMVSSLGYKAAQKVTVESVRFEDMMFESGVGYLNLNGESVTIKNVTVRNIG